MKNGLLEIGSFIQTSYSSTLRFWYTYEEQLILHHISRLAEEKSILSVNQLYTWRISANLTCYPVRIVQRPLVVDILKPRHILIPRDVGPSGLWLLHMLLEPLVALVNSLHYTYILSLLLPTAFKSISSPPCRYVFRIIQLSNRTRPTTIFLRWVNEEELENTNRSYISMHDRTSTALSTCRLFFPAAFARMQLSISDALEKCWMGEISTFFTVRASSYYGEREQLEQRYWKREGVIWEWSRWSQTGWMWRECRCSRIPHAASCRCNEWLPWYLQWKASRSDSL